ncbi:glycoside hydrolase family 3 N-terminal domain-containing protein [Nibricoccus sp. IMCC34717]|uniref:glycoside hydrolase family 3 N-terminal domain-containing protein n=1 Tax=Nibricoccus sp. IMCC34717 TaxID=3034021 RepID=UPI00384E35F6
MAVRVADLLARMNPEEKLAQTMGFWRDGGRLMRDDGSLDNALASKALRHGIGSISRQREKLSPRDSARFANAVQRWLRDHTRLGIPALLHAEALHGDMELGGTHFPQPLALATSWSPEWVERVFQVAAREVRSRGGHHVLGPNLDLGREPRWGRTEETYGEDPFLTSCLGVAAVRGLQGRGATIDREHVMACGKHFAGHGQPEAGTNGAPVSATPRQLRDFHFKPFEAAVREARLASIMPAYHEIDGVPCHGNAWLLNDVLRGEWGFDGLVVSDYYAVEQLLSRHAVGASKAEVAALALASGVDVELPDADGYPTLLTLAAQGRLDTAVARVLRWKFELGLFDDPFVDEDRAASIVNCAAHRELAVEVAKRAMVLLINRNGTLPLQPSLQGKIAVIGPNADRAHLGGYSDEPGRGVSLLDGIRNRVGAARVLHAVGCQITKEGGDWWADGATLAEPTSERQRIAEAVAIARDAEVIVLAIGGNEDTHKEGWHETHLGDRDTIELPGLQQELFDALKVLGKPVVVCLIHSGPLAIPQIAEQADAILDCFYPGQEGGTAAAALLFGDQAPEGRLTITYPRSTGQIPAAYNHKPTARRGYLFTSKDPVFPFGHGLTYTTFAYANLRAHLATLRIGEAAVVRIDISNTGTKPGSEVVQVYVRDDASSVTRPVLELKAFERVTLQPGEKKTVELHLPPESFSFTGPAMRTVCEPGTFTVQVGPNAATGQKIVLTLLP